MVWKCLWFSKIFHELDYTFFLMLLLCFSKHAMASMFFIFLITFNENCAMLSVVIGVVLLFVLPKTLLFLFFYDIVLFIAYFHELDYTFS